MTLARRILVAAFAVAVVATVALGIRLVASTVYWSQHQDAPIEAWMSVGMVARSYGLPRAVLDRAAGIAEGARDRRPLSEIAADQGVAPAALIQRLEAAIAGHRPAAPPDDGGTRRPPDEAARP